MTTPAYVNHGRWVADCEACRSALRVSPGDEFTCLECGHHDADVFWPDDWADIDAVLALRPSILNRNWLPGETLDDLRAENLEHGLVPGMPSPPVGEAAPPGPPP